MKKVLLSLSLMFLFSLTLLAQTPQYYNYQNVGASNNNFPFNVAAGKCSEWLFLPGDFNQPSPLPAGKQITKVYFWVTTGGSPTYTNLHILMKQDTITAFTSGAFYAGAMDTVYSNASVSLPGTTGTWVSITLTKPFVYDPTKSLIVMAGQCGQSGTGLTIKQNALTGIRRVWSVGGCPFAPYAGGDGSVANFGVDVENAPAPNPLPELIYYRFENNPTATTTPNYASAPVGTNPVPIVGLPLTSGGQFDSCLSGTGGTGSTASISTGWNWNLTGNWTIGFWIKDLLETSSGSPCYLFGDPGSGSLRCFYGGAALPNNTIFRGPFSSTGYTVSTPMPGNYYIHYVWDGTNIVIYKNGVLVSTNPTTNTMPTGTGFKVGGYSTSSYSLNGKMDEFRLYNRALTATEIANTWNIELGVITGVTPISSNVPKEYSLKQNYPNPFNPVTKISFDLPKSGLVTLKIYDVLGREVKTLVNEVKNAGSYLVDFDGSSFTSGTYFYRMESNGYISTKKMVLIK